jgi:hypothetical protein
MIKLKELLKEHEVDKNRLNKAFLFFIKDLKLPSDRITLNFKTLKNAQATVDVKKQSGKLHYDVNMQTYNVMSNDEQVKRLAHEMIHIQQMESGIFDLEKFSYNGIVYEKPKTQSEEDKLPWEVDARVQSPELVYRFNRYLLNNAPRKVTKI